MAGGLTRKYAVRLVGNVDNLNGALGTVVKSAFKVARTLGPSGPVAVAIKGLSLLLNPLALTIGGLATAFGGLAVAGVKALRQLEEQAMQTVGRIHNDMRQLKDDLQFAMNTGGVGPSEAIAATGAALRAGYGRGESSYGVARVGVEYSRRMGIDPVEGTNELIQKARALNMTVEEYWQHANLDDLPRNASYWKAASKAEKERALTDWGRSFPVFDWLSRGTRQGMGAAWWSARQLAPANIWDAGWEAAFDSGSDKWFSVAGFRRGMQWDTRPRTITNRAQMTQDRLLRGDFAGFQGDTLDEVLASNVGRRYSVENQEALANVARIMQGNREADRAMFTRQQFAGNLYDSAARAMQVIQMKSKGVTDYQALVTAGMSGAQQTAARREQERQQYGATLQELRAFVQDLGVTRESVLKLSNAALVATAGLGRISYQDAGKMALYNLDVSEATLRRQLAAGADPRPTKTVIPAVRRPGTGEVIRPEQIIMKPGIADELANIAVQRQQLLNADNNGGGGGGGSVAVNPGAHYFSSGTARLGRAGLPAPGTGTLWTQALEEELNAKGETLIDRTTSLP